MARSRLTQRRVESLRCQRTVRDSELKGYGNRMSPSGTKRYFNPGSKGLEDRTVFPTAPSRPTPHAPCPGAAIPGSNSVNFDCR